MSASINDKITAVENGGAPVATTVSSARSIGGTSLSCVALTNWPTDTAVHLITYQKNADGTINTDTLCLWKGIVSGTTIGTLTLKDGTDAGNSVGDFVEMAPTSAYAQDLYNALVTSHNTDGTMIDSLPLTTPKITTSINDANGNEVIKTPATASAVNEITVTNAATGNAPTISATGGDTNIGIKIAGRGNGALDLDTLLLNGVTTYTNPGTAGGTSSFFYTNLGGIKLFWGKTNSITTSTTGVTKIITLPAYFTTITSISSNVTDMTVDARLMAAVSANTITELAVTIWSAGGSSPTGKVNVFVVGT
jgi:hypothetical protein